ncbi:MAG: purine-nucleoside phosphorylase [Pseudomonadota bacterium]
MSQAGLAEPRQQSTSVTKSVEVIHKASPGFKPRAAIVLGSGLNQVTDALAEKISIPYSALPAFPSLSVSSHAGSLALGRLAGRDVCILQGRSHYYEHGDASVMRGALETLSALGCETLFLTNAAGSLRAEVGPGRLMAISDHIGFLGRNPLIGDREESRFVDLSAAYDPDLLARLKQCASKRAIDLAEGVYLWVSGPSFETPAEIRAMCVLGADAVGMSTVPETILARRLGLEVVAVSAITNLAAGMEQGELSHTQTKSAAALAAEDMTRLITDFIGTL